MASASFSSATQWYKHINTKTNISNMRLLGQWQHLCYLGTWCQTWEANQNSGPRTRWRIRLTNKWDRWYPINGWLLWWQSWRTNDLAKWLLWTTEWIAWGSTTGIGNAALVNAESENTTVTLHWFIFRCASCKLVFRDSTRNLIE